MEIRPNIFRVDVPLGTAMQVAQKTTPMRYFLRLDELSDTLFIDFASMLLISELATDFVVNVLYSKPNIFKNEIKKNASLIYDPDGVSINKNASSMGLRFAGYAERIRLSIKANMKESDYSNFLKVVSRMKARTTIESMKIYNSCSMIVSKTCEIKHKDVFTKGLTLLMQCHTVNVITSDSKTLAGHNKFYLCKDRRDEKGRARAYYMEPEDVVGIIKALEKILVSLAGGSKKFMLECNNETLISSNNFLKLLINAENVYSDAASIGLDLHNTSTEVSSPEYIAKKNQEKREENLRRIQHAKEVDELIEKRDSAETKVKELAELKGWRSA